MLDAFLLRAMALAGWAPALTECARCGRPGPHAAFHVASGGLLCPDCRGAGSVGTAARRPPRSLLMAALAGGDWAAAEAAPDTARREASGLVAALLQWHLERGLRSLPMVDRGVSVPIDRHFRALQPVDQGRAPGESDCRWASLVTPSARRPAPERRPPARAAGRRGAQRTSRW